MKHISGQTWITAGCTPNAVKLLKPVNPKSPGQGGKLPKGGIKWKSEQIAGH